MKKLIYVYLALAYLVCNYKPAVAQTTPLEKKIGSDENAKKRFLAQGEVFFQDEKLKEAIQTLSLTDTDVVAYCRANPDIALRSKFISAIFSEKEYNDEPAKEQFWAAYRFNVSKFVETVSIVREDEQKTFMDIGSGNGEKLYGALCLGFDKVFGLEYSKKSYKTSLKHLANFSKETEITLGDALAIEPAYFQKADFLYMYSPIKDSKMMASLFKRAMENMKEGAILLEVRCVYSDELRKQMAYDFPTINSWLAIKKKGGKYYYKNIIDGAYSYDSADNREWQELKSKK